MKRSLMIALTFCCVLACNTTVARHTNNKHSLVSCKNSFTGSYSMDTIGGYRTYTGGLEYERFLSQAGYFSFTAKIIGYTGGSYHRGLENYETHSWTYGGGIAPGLRFHPFKHSHRLDLGIGLSAPLGSGNRRDFRVTPGITTARPDYIYANDFFGAVLLDLSLNLQGRNKGLISVFTSAGMIYSNAHVTFSDTHDDPLYLQFGVRFGGSW